MSAAWLGRRTRPRFPCGRPSQSCADGGAELDSCSASHILAGAQRNDVRSGRRPRLTRRSGRLPRSRARGAAFRSCSRPASRTSAVAATSRGTPTTMTPLKTFKCSFPFRNISIPGSEPSVPRELRSNSFPHFSFSSAQLHDVWLGGASVLGSHLAGEPSAGAYVFALRGRFCVTEYKTKAGTPLPSDRALINARAPPPRPRGGPSSAYI